MLIRDVVIWGGPRADLRIRDGVIADIGNLPARPGERIIEANGGALLPGLHDHHIHLAAAAAAMDSVRCGPPQVHDAAGLAAALCRDGQGWLRGIGYHECVAGMPCREQIDAMVADRPVRIQHRSGRMWFLNSLALETLLELAEPPPGLERRAGRWTGRLFDEDAWLRRTLAGRPPALGTLSAGLAACGVTGVTDMSPGNGADAAAWLRAEQASSRLLQHCVVAGREDLSGRTWPAGLSCGPVKLHLHDHALPDPDAMAATVAAAHARGRPVAVHCTTEVELVFALAAIEAAGAAGGDRIEHAGIASDVLVAQVAQLGLQVVSQPQFIAERGDQYAKAIARGQWPQLYRLRAFIDAGVTLAAGSDAPYGSNDPWAAMRAAVSRRTDSGIAIGPDEALTPEEAVRLYLCDPHDLARQRTVTIGAPADLCLLDRPWGQARDHLRTGMVRATIARGRLVHDGVDEAPFERGLRADAAA